MISEQASSLGNHFLIAMPEMTDPNFGGAVIFIAEHSPKGALGLVINRPTDLDLGTLFERIDLSLDPPHAETNIVIFRLDARLGTAADFVSRLQEHGVQMGVNARQKVRAVTHMDVTTADVQQAAAILREAAGG